MTTKDIGMEEFDWESWKNNFCKHISDWSYFSANEELEKMKESLVSVALQHREEEIREGVEELKADIDQKTSDGDAGYIQALDDVLSLLNDLSIKK